MEDISPLIPESFTYRFPTRRCTGTYSSTIPDNYVKKIDLSTIAADAGIDGFKGSKVFHEYALALFDAGGTDPTNKTAIDALATKHATDYYKWATEQFDSTYNNVLNTKNSSLYDEIILDYDIEGCTTRLRTGVVNDDPEELMHWDSSTSSCTGASGTYTAAPCVEVYGPPASCSGGSLVITVYRVCMVDGRLVSTYVRQDTIT